MLSAAPNLIRNAFDTISEEAPGAIPRVIKKVLKGTRDKSYIERSYNVHLADDIHGVDLSLIHI